MLQKYETFADVSSASSSLYNPYERFTLHSTVFLNVTPTNLSQVYLKSVIVTDSLNLDTVLFNDQTGSVKRCNWILNTTNNSMTFIPYIEMIITYNGVNMLFGPPGIVTVTYQAPAGNIIIGSNILLYKV